MVRFNHLTNVRRNKVTQFSYTLKSFLFFLCAHLFPIMGLTPFFVTVSIVVHMDFL